MKREEKTTEPWASVCRRSSSSSSERKRCGARAVPAAASSKEGGFCRQDIGALKCTVQYENWPVVREGGRARRIARVTTYKRGRERERESKEKKKQHTEVETRKAEIGWVRVFLGADSNVT